MIAVAMDIAVISLLASFKRIQWWNDPGVVCAFAVLMADCGSFGTQADS